MQYLRLTLVLTALLTGLAGSAAADPSAQAQPDPLLEKGRALYNYRCYFCHGYSGDAKTLTSTYLATPPRDFTQSDRHELTEARIIKALKEGIPGTAMVSFSRLLSEDDMKALAYFIRVEFMEKRAPNTAYHTPENGWPNHERYAIAFPFARGEITLDTPVESLTDAQREGRRLYLTSCVSCHDHGTGDNTSPAWEPEAISFPRNNFSWTQPDAWTGASSFAIHDKIPVFENMTPDQKAGQALWQKNCAFCHAADGTGKNWIGQFLEPRPRNLTNPGFMRNINRTQLKKRIQDGLEGTSMPAWKHVLEEHQIDQIIDYIDLAFHPVQDDSQN